MYKHPEFPSYEEQIGARDHMQEKHPTPKTFLADASGDVCLWRLQNLFTAANKSSYIDSSADLDWKNNSTNHSIDGVPIQQKQSFAIPHTKPSLSG
jgi:hypothetical protein